MGIGKFRSPAAWIRRSPVLVPVLLAAACTSNQQGPSVQYPQGDIVAAVGMSIPRDRPALQDGAGAPFTVSPALPPGLALDPDSGAISGRPTAESAPRTYTVTAKAGTGTLDVPVRITVGPAGSVKTQVLNVPVEMQLHTEWCEIASSASLLTYLGNPQPQCHLFNYTQDITYACRYNDFYWNDPVILRGCDRIFGPRSSVTDLLTHYGLTCTGRYSALSFQEIKAEIDADRPFLIHWIHENSSGHSLVGIGWDESGDTQTLVVMDPMVGYRRLSYDWACMGYDSHSYSSGGNWNAWDRTITLDP